MFLPGRILQLQQVEGSVPVSYRISERRREDFDHILVSVRMLLDHLPNYQHKVFRNNPENLVWSSPPV